MSYDPKLDTKVSDIIKAAGNDGIKYDDIQKKSGIKSKVLDDILFNLMLEGTIYEPYPSTFIILD